MIRITGLAKRFGAIQVLREIDLRIHAGRITGIIGPNGAGKTTLIKMILGLIRADHGMIELSGAAIGPSERYREHIGYMPQVAPFPDNLTGEELFAMLCELRGVTRPIDADLLQRFELGESMKRPLRVLSGGTRQKVNAAVAFAFAPELLILDEPTAGLDPVASGVLKAKIVAEQRAGRTVVVTSHVMSELEELCDDVVLLLDGRIRFAGSLHDLKVGTRELSLERAIAALMTTGVAA